MALFRDRSDAGRRLAEVLKDYEGRSDVVVLGLPRGGVKVAYEVAKELDAPLRAYLVRKLGVPGQEELAFGALANDGSYVLNEDVVSALGIDDRTIDAIKAKEQAVIDAREESYGEAVTQIDVTGCVVLLVDDGLATGATVRAAAEALRHRQPATIVVAVPVASPEACTDMEAVADEVICAETPRPFGGVGYWYDDFTQTTDDEVRALLNASISGEPGGDSRS